ncbi:hypothetical protein EE612_034449 [Oryza sativa]|nr:hypothetical protein EE612_034449 [Oryza sativa]
MSSELSMFMLLCMSSDLYIFRSPVYILRYFIIAYYYRWQRCLILFFYWISFSDMPCPALSANMQYQFYALDMAYIPPGCTRLHFYCRLVG